MSSKITMTPLDIPMMIPSTAANFLIESETQLVHRILTTLKSIIAQFP
jgi:hypothetical protein